MNNDGKGADNADTGVGDGAPPKRAAGRAAAGFARGLGVSMLVVLALGLLLSALNPATFAAPAASYDEVLAGEWMAAYQAEYERRLPIRAWAANTWGLLQYALFREGRPGVLIGADNWLFTTEEFTHHRDAERQIEQHASVVAEVRQRLRQRDIELVVALVPAKARIYSEHLGRYTLPEYTEPRYRQFRSALLQRGITAPDLERVLQRAKAGERVFLRTDTHWTPQGARVAAGALAEVVDRLLERRHAPRRRFAPIPEGKRTYAGDLTAFLPVMPFRGRVGAQADQIWEYRVEDLDPPDIGLFDEVPHPVTLVGTSYSAGDVWDFEGALKVELQAAVLNLAEEGRGPFAPMCRYLAGDTIDEVPPDVVVWEIPERYVSAPADPVF